MDEDQDLKFTIAKGIEFRAYTWDILQHVARVDEKSDAVLRFLSVALQHQHSIILLIEQGNPSSALALLRCMNDTCYRGVWAATCDDYDKIRKILSEEFDYGNIGAKLAATYGEGLPEETRDFMHSLTHTGHEQLKRQFSARGYYEPEFEPELLTGAIRAASALLVLLTANAFKILGRDDLASQLWGRFRSYFGEEKGN